MLALERVIEVNGSSEVIDTETIHVREENVASIEPHPEFVYDSARCSIVRIAGAAPFTVRESASDILTALSL